MGTSTSGHGNMWLESLHSNHEPRCLWLAAVCTVWSRLNLEAGQELTHRYHHVIISKKGRPA
jgi:hypothetical protein